MKKKILTTFSSHFFKFWFCPLLTQRTYIFTDSLPRILAFTNRMCSADLLLFIRLTVHIFLYACVVSLFCSVCITFWYIIFPWIISTVIVFWLFFPFFSNGGLLLHHNNKKATKIGHYMQLYRFWKLGRYAVGRYYRLVGEWLYWVTVKSVHILQEISPATCTWL